MAVYNKYRLEEYETFTQEDDWPYEKVIAHFHIEDLFLKIWNKKEEQNFLQLDQILHHLRVNNDYGPDEILEEVFEQVLGFYSVDWEERDYEDYIIKVYQPNLKEFLKTFKQIMNIKDGNVTLNEIEVAMNV